MLYLLPSREPKEEWKWFVCPMRIFGSQSDRRCLCPVRVLFYSQWETHEVPLCRALSVDLQFSKTTKDLMTKFVKCLGRLPNLRTLEVSSTTAFAPVTRRLKRRCARFPSVLQLGISDTTVKFVRSCPNVESIAISDELSSDNIKVLGSYIRERSEKSRFKRLIGVNKFDVHQGELRDILLSETPVHRWRITEVVQDCSDLQEIGISESGFAIRPVVSPRVKNIQGSHAYCF